MCSIIGYSGNELAAPILVKGLKRMEYRGYDSVGVATKSEEKIEIKKGTGKVNEVNLKIQLDSLSGNIGIGHTRWASHGKVTTVNAHPHLSNSGNIAIVHNGIIENFEEIKSQLTIKGYNFHSQTDSEIIVNLLEENYKLTKNVKDTIIKTISEIKGDYTFVAMFENGQLAAARYHEPLILGIAENELFLSSDVLGFIEYTDNAIYMENESFVIIDKNKFQILDFHGKNKKYEIVKVSKEFGDVYKGDYAHYTLKEIYEQHETILKTNSKTEEGIKQAVQYIKNTKNVYITGSGTSYNSALIAKQLFSKYKIKSESIISSELQFLPESIEKNSVMIAISQSGESADVLDAVNIAKKGNCKIISIVNLLTSSLARESDVVIGINCGPEIGVAATKSFTSQLGIIYKIVEKLDNTKIDFKRISELISNTLENPKKIQQIAKELKHVSDIYILGRGMHYPIAMEAALKLKELAYIHAEGIAGGELKHGPLALMDSNVFVLVINPNDSTYSDTLTSTREIKARGAKIIGISDIQNDIYDYQINIQKADQLSYMISEIVPIQLLSYYTALEKDTDPDYPRNLAKSVTIK